MEWITLALTFIGNHWLDLVAIGALVCVLGLQWKRGNKKWVLHLINKLIVEAEQILGTKTGKMKMDYVLTGVYKLLPFIVRVFFSEEQFRQLIEQELVKIKEDLIEKESNLLGLSAEKLLNES